MAEPSEQDMQMAAEAARLAGLTVDQTPGLAQLFATLREEGVLAP